MTRRSPYQYGLEGLKAKETQADLPLIASHMHFLLIHSNGFVGQKVQLEKNKLHELDNVAKQFLGNAFAGAVDGQLHIGTGEHHGGCKHGDGYGLSKASRCADLRGAWGYMRS